MPRDLYFSGQIAVDTGHHVITHAETVFAEGRDGDYLKTIVNKTKLRLGKYDMHIKNALTDAAYSSGENYMFLEQQNITAYIPLLGGALSGSEGFVYDEETDCYICPNNKILKGSGRIVDDGREHPIRKYLSLKSDCDKCPIRNACISAGAKTKKVQHSYYKPQLEAAKQRAESIKGQIMKIKRSSTVEPVWGTLINFTGMRRLNARGLDAANKVLVLASVCYNLKKWMKFTMKSKCPQVIAIVNIGLHPFYSFLKTIAAHLKVDDYFLNHTGSKKGSLQKLNGESSNLFFAGITLVYLILCCATVTCVSRIAS
jgi:hypothetical protein